MGQAQSTFDDEAQPREEIKASSALANLAFASSRFARNASRSVDVATRALISPDSPAVLNAVATSFDRGVGFRRRPSFDVDEEVDDAFSSFDVDNESSSFPDARATTTTDDRWW